MRTAIVGCVSVGVGCLWLAAGCSKPPAWSEVRAGVNGDSTNAGDPAPVKKVTAPPKIDGILDDWNGATVLGPLIDSNNGNVIAGSGVASIGQISWDDKHLYIGLVVHDKAPTSPFTRDEVDPHVWSQSSGVEIVLQPGDPKDNLDYYEIQVDSNGAVFDSHFDDYNKPQSGTGVNKLYGHQEWSSQIERAVHIEPGSFYSVEIALPFAALAPGRVAIPPHAGDVWRMNLYTFRDGQREALAWSPIKGEGNFHFSKRWGRIKFE